MASEVDICNIALSNLGDEATVASIDPPEGSAQADHCARWYPLARDQVLQSHSWSFATRRAVLAPVQFDFTEWRFAYAQPDDCIKFFAVLPPNALSDYSDALAYPTRSTFGDFRECGEYGYAPQEFATETDEDGNVVILTNQDQATGRFVARVTDTTKFSPIFVQAVSRLLASYLAGPIIKGVDSIQIASGQYQAFQIALSKAIQADGIQRQVRPQHIVPWMRR